MKQPPCVPNWTGRHWWQSMAHGDDPYNPQERCRNCGIRREPVGDEWEYTDRDGNQLTRRSDTLRG